MDSTDIGVPVLKAIPSGQANKTAAAIPLTSDAFKVSTELQTNMNMNIDINTISYLNMSLIAQLMGSGITFNN